MRVLKKSVGITIVAVTALMGGIGIANAAPQVIGQDGLGNFNVETGAIYSANGSPVGYQGDHFTGGIHGGQGWGQVLQNSMTDHPYLTDKMTVDRSSATSMNITMHTMFDGVEQFNGNIHYADLFITERAGAALDQPNSNWAYGIALGGGLTPGCTNSSTCAGGQLLNGGRAAGVYAINGASGYMTSEQVWAGRGGAYVGGSVALTSVVNATAAGAAHIGFDPPTRVVTAQAALSSLSVAVTRAVDVNGFYNINVALTDSTGGAALNSLFTNFDLFWGTGDCSNDAIWGNVTQAGFGVPAPGALALLGFGLLGMFGLSRRRAL